MVVDVEAKVADVVERVLGRVDRHVALGRVQHVGNSHAAQVLQVLDGLSVGDEDARVDLVAVDVDRLPLLPTVIENSLTCSEHQASSIHYIQG